MAVRGHFRSVPRNRNPAPGESGRLTNDSTKRRDGPLRPYPQRARDDFEGRRERAGGFAV